MIENFSLEIKKIWSHKDKEKDLDGHKNNKNTKSQAIKNFKTSSEAVERFQDLMKMYYEKKHYFARYITKHIFT